MPEILDVFDASFNFIGKEERSEVHKKGLWHQTFHCWVIKDGKFVAQLRSKDKDTNPGLLGVSSAGHLSAGEKLEDGIREIKEELGLDVDFDKLTYLGRSISVSDKPNKKIIPYHNREFCHSFILKNDLPLNKYKLQAEELDGIFEIDIKDGEKLFSGETESIEIEGCVLNNGVLEKEIRNVKITNFTQHADFWLRIMILSEDFCSGRKYLKI